VLSLTATVALRGDATAFAAIVYGSTASPEPEFPPEKDTQFACAATVHVHSRAALIVSEPDPPAAPN
jgi:hypothetical protein